MITLKRMPSDYRWATEYEESFSNEQPDAVVVMVKAFGSSEPYLAVPSALPFPCVREFGEHDCGGEDCESVDILYNMNAPVPDDGLAYAYNRELEAESLGRPLFPNEY